jgi:hypothetical protein
MGVRFFVVYVVVYDSYRGGTGGDSGIGTFAGLRCIDVEGATGLYNTNYEGKAQAAIEALKTDDFVYLHVEASDEAGHEGDVPLKLKTIEDLDSRIVGPVYEAVKQWDEPVAITVNENCRWKCHNICCVFTGLTVRIKGKVGIVCPLFFQDAFCFRNSLFITIE